MEYMTLLRWISEGIGIEQYQYSIISRENYSWCEVVSYENCVQEWELQQYYKRLGIQLFLVYLLGTKIFILKFDSSWRISCFCGFRNIGKYPIQSKA